MASHRLSYSTALHPYIVYQGREHLMDRLVDVICCTICGACPGSSWFGMNVTSLCHTWHHCQGIISSFQHNFYTLFLLNKSDWVVVYVRMYEKEYIEINMYICICVPSRGYDTYIYYLPS